MRIVGRYALHEPIGRGASASVLLGVQRGDPPVVVAVKRLHDDHARNPRAVVRLVDEVRLARHVVHENVVETKELVSDGEEMLVVMEYVHGEPLSRLLARARELRLRLPTPIACAIACDVLAGLHAAHEARDAAGAPLRIVHRDVTPDNVIIAADGIAKLADFGVAKAEGRLEETRNGGVKGKLAYLAPEQVGGEVGPRTDLYAVGLVLWEMLTLERPLEASNEAALLVRALDPEISPPSVLAGAENVLPALDAVVMKALEKDPERRFDTASHFAAAIADAVPIASRAELAAWIQAMAGDRLAERAAELAKVMRLEVPRSRATPIALKGPVLMFGVATAIVALALGWHRLNADPPAPPAIVSSSDAPPVPPAPPAPPASAAAVSATPAIVSASGSASAPAPSSAPRKAPRPPATRAHASCDPPWFIDEQGIKRYDPGCVK